MSETPAAPPDHTQFSLTTSYGDGCVINEFFGSQQARTESLLERLEQFFDDPSQIPSHVRGDEERLASLVALFISNSASITLGSVPRI